MKNASGHGPSLVELVDASGMPVGAATVVDAHTSPGMLHRAFSVLLVDGHDRILLQQRAATKTRFPLRWANTCCGHPAPGQGLVDAATVRLTQEMGIRAVTLTPVAAFVYRADDPVSGLVEWEYDHVLVARVDPDLPLDPDPTEVGATTWAHVPRLPANGQTHLDVARLTSPDYAPWLVHVVTAADRYGRIR